MIWLTGKSEYCLHCGVELQPPRKKFCSWTCCNRYHNKLSYLRRKHDYESMSQEEKDKFGLFLLENLERGGVSE